MAAVPAIPAAIRRTSAAGWRRWPELGWSCLEGTLEFASGGPCSGSAPVAPIAEYGRLEGCSITSGFVYRGQKYPALHGVYLSGDYCTGRIFGLKSGTGGFDITTLVDTPHSISNFGEDESGDIYIADYFRCVFLLSDGEPRNGAPGQVGTQFWVTGHGTVAARTLVAEMTSSTGTAFGTAFNPGDVRRARWGAIEIEFTGCDAAVLRWNASGANSSGFGSGCYPLIRLGSSAASQRCNQVGFAAANDLEWVSGTWYGGAARDGEGLFLDRLADGTVLVAFFTHRPAGTQ
jgi:hypothetical protein